MWKTYCSQLPIQGKIKQIAFERVVTNEKTK